MTPLEIDEVLAVFGLEAVHDLRVHHDRQVAELVAGTLEQRRQPALQAPAIANHEPWTRRDRQSGTSPAKPISMNMNGGGRE